MSKTIIVTITPDGEANVETTGFVGRECIEATAGVKTNLGLVTEASPTAEYHRQIKEVDHVKQGR